MFLLVQRPGFSSTVDLLGLVGSLGTTTIIVTTFRIKKKILIFFVQALNKLKVCGNVFYFKLN